MSEVDRADLCNVERSDGAAPPTSADSPAPPAETSTGTVAEPECARCALQTEVPLPKVPTRDSALGRTVREWLAERPDLRDPQYVDLLLLKAMLRRHYGKLSAGLTANGVLTKSEGKPKEALGILLSMVGEIRRIDEQLPSPPPPPPYRYVRRCRRCSCDSCKAGAWGGRGDSPEGEELDAGIVEEATRIAAKVGQEPEALIAALVALEADQRELQQLRREAAKLKAREAERAREQEAATEDMSPAHLAAAKRERLQAVRDGIWGPDADGAGGEMAE